jgi:nucleoside-diphosphate-sugar epimerase
LRLANVYGPGDFGRVIPIFLRSALLGEPLLLFGGEQILDFIWFEDVVDALIAAGGSQAVAGPLNIGSGVGMQVTEVARKIVALAGSSSPVRLLPKRDFEVMRFVADTSAAKRSLVLNSNSDPLAHLGELMEWTRHQLRTSGATE